MNMQMCLYTSMCICICMCMYVYTRITIPRRRLMGMKLAAEASGRKIAFIGTSLFTYLEAAWRDGRAPFDPRTVIQPNEVEDYDPNELLVITTGSQVR